MPADRRSKFPQTRASGRQTMVNNISGGRGGSGGEGHGTGTGGAGGRGMGPALNFNISIGQFTMHNNVHGDEYVGPDSRFLSDASGTVTSRPEIRTVKMQSGEIHCTTRVLGRLYNRISITTAIEASLEAIHDSMDSFPQPKCHPETRTKMLGDLRKWALDTHSQTTILWVYGPAGAGKSAIMRTLATQLHEDGRLGGCFFFKRGHTTRGNAKTVITTIAYQLAIRVPWLRTRISQIVENDPSIVGQSIASQVMVFNRRYLRAIRNTSSNHLISPRFIVASRPEPHIREVFNTPLYSGHYRSVNVEQSFEDVHKYLSDEFARIHREHDTMRNIPLPWPSSDILWELARKSSGHFIYASTIIKFIDDQNYRPTHRLAVVQDPNSSGSESAFDVLDQLYMTILRSAPRQSQLIPILCAIVHFGLGTSEIDRLFGLAEGETQLLLRGLHSVFNVPRDDEDGIFSHHASFVDFLRNPGRSGNFCVGTLNRKISLARSLLQIYAARLIRFIVSLPRSGAVAELFPFIGSINPEYIFDSNPEEHGDLASVTSWLKNSPSAPADVIGLWQDYVFMFSINTMHLRTQSPSVQHTVSPPARNFSAFSLRPKLVGDEHALPIHLPQAAYPWAARDLALQLIHKMVKNHIDSNGGLNPSACRHAVSLYNAKRFLCDLKEAYTRAQYDLGRDISYLVRLSPPCPVLYRELWRIPPSEIWSSWSAGSALIHHVSKWLECFPDSLMELVTFWQQAVPEDERPLNRGPLFLEPDWRVRVTYYNNMIVPLAELHQIPRAGVRKDGSG
ncbi:hypothetical protein B0H14DRAFT_2650748 [Mycena olivaceomarginata]|nr:hypothetical protein B0H14DRAFT_2650748 [Mycena olivaceomarginata]